jgi:hypothetical protein
MAYEEHLGILRQGVEVWNRWKRENPEVKVDLHKADLRLTDLGAANLSRVRIDEADLGGANLESADLSGADLSSSNLSDANLVRADLRWADLNRADFHGANLGSANLRDAYLSGANLSAVDLREANLYGASLGGADLRAANLSEANLSGTYLGGAKFHGALLGYSSLGNVDLSDAEGLQEVHHQGPSTIGIDAIYRSQGKIPVVFLRGAGVPESFIEYMKSLVGSPVEYYSCFISYSSKDEEFAQRLYADLQAKGVRCWFAPHDLQGGRKLYEQIDQAIRVHERVLLILSEHSMNSEWVKTEIAKARKREDERKKQVLFPVRLVSFEAIRDWECFDGDTGKDSAREIRECFIPDFSGWRGHDKYKMVFERLLRDLKA